MLGSRLFHHRHGPFLFGLTGGILSLLATLALQPKLALGIPINVFFLIYLVMMGYRIPRLDADALKARASNDDEPAPLILTVTLVAAAGALVALFHAINRQTFPGMTEITAAFLSVFLGWVTLHTMFALHYAHHYWRPAEQERENETQRGGLDFPQTPDPGAWDFLYFSFVIGMTAQTSDVAITTKTMRRINLVHAVVSFFFNTVLVAASVNAVVSLAG
ncbi:DUF1345 domain-containing protein [Rhizobium halophytocola]|uniref:Membrane protein n=1 Tax=Rhizobium halophytocola TaxID=735519 RepID=A0ABS4DZN2_9HYPH|nr:DUF1345 domain-containing protein [Rhizobium halophytocola]MBP1851154.1 putative membrane protein [Rhizobium halophytocola]